MFQNVPEPRYPKDDNEGQTQNLKKRGGINGMNIRNKVGNGTEWQRCALA